jgi:hypothetical protein
MLQFAQVSVTARPVACRPTHAGVLVSLANELTQLEEHVKTRLRELKPLVDEYSDLEAVAKRLGIAIPEQTGAPSRPRRRRASAASGTGAAKPTSKPARTAGRSRTRTAHRPAGKRRDDVLAAVREHPGITVRELGEQLGVDPTSLYRVVHGLESDGLVNKAGRGLEPRAAGASATTAAPSDGDERGSGSPAPDAATEAATTGS